MKRPIDPTAALRTLSMAQKLGISEQNALRMHYWNALDALKRGQGRLDHLDTLAGAVNVALVLAERTGNNDDALALIKSAQDALMRAEAREAQYGVSVPRPRGDEPQRIRRSSHRSGCSPPTRG